MEIENTVQELKAERVQEELMAQEPFRIWLKAERIQEPELAAAGAEGTPPSSFELALSQPQAVTIELLSVQAVVTLYGPAGQ